MDMDNSVGIAWEPEVGWAEVGKEGKNGTTVIEQ